MVTKNHFDIKMYFHMDSQIIWRDSEQQFRITPRISTG